MDENARSELGKIIWDTSRRDEGTISVTGANIIADAILANGWVKVVPAPPVHKSADICNKCGESRGAIRREGLICWDGYGPMGRHSFVKSDVSETGEQQ